MTVLDVRDRVRGWISRRWWSFGIARCARCCSKRSVGTTAITQRLTKPRSPTTTGKIERFHKTLRAEFLDRVAPFESLDAAQAAVDVWIEGYNHQRPHRSLDMATPANLFRPNGPTRIDSPPTPADRNRGSRALGSRCHRAPYAGPQPAGGGVRPSGPAQR
ncbi:integrase core domain-containing protein [Haloactinomyces albus]|uniref:integrase core domain-containing protein n=1 Tax=Haloactinomyces albus TaxID=1352928 RepID=UPI0035B5151F